MAINPKAAIRFPPIIHAYLDDLVEVGVFGKDRSSIIRRFVEEGIQAALKAQIIAPRKRSEFAGNEGAEGGDDAA